MDKNDQPGWDREEVFALIFCQCKHSSALEDCEMHKPCGAHDHPKAVIGKETKIQFLITGKRGKNIWER